jgi:hypothetical protein
VAKSGPIPALQTSEFKDPASEWVSN